MRAALLEAAIFFSDGGGRRLTTYSAAGAYFMFISLVPLTMLICSVLQFTQLSEELVLEAVAEYVPNSLLVIVRRIVAGVYDSSAGTVTLSAVLTLWSASSSVKGLMRGLDSVCGVERREGFIVFSLRAMGYLLLFVAMLVLSFFVMVYGGRILSRMRSFLPAGAAVDCLVRLARGLRFPAVAALLALAFAFIYSRLPARGERRTRVWPGAGLAAAAWLGFSWLFSLYVSLSGRFGAYGILGSILLSMMWMFFCFYFLLLGGYVNTLGAR